MGEQKVWNQMPNTCWDCKYNSIKLKVLVPYDRTIKEYMHHTGNFQSEIVAVVKEKHEQYTVWYRSEGEMRIVTFKMLHICSLKIEQPKKQVACPSYCRKEEQNVVSNIIYSKLPMPEEIKTELLQQAEL